MKKVLCFGEALIDFLYTKSSPQGPINIAEFSQFPGGAPANVAVAVAKLGGRAAFAGQVGSDMFGQFLQQSLRSYGVDTASMLSHPDAHTALAFVFLDSSGDRSFEFYRQQTADLLLKSEQIDSAWFDDCTIAHICSNTLVNESILETTNTFLGTAREKGCLISFDVNLRHNLWPQGKCDRDVVREVLKRADLVKASREEVDFLEPEGVSAFADTAFASGVRLVVVTDGAEPIDVRLPDRQFSVEPPGVTAIDTTAAGDGFVGGMLYKLAERSDPAAVTGDIEALADVLFFAACCGAFTASQEGVMNALPTLANVQAMQS